MANRAEMLLAPVSRDSRIIEIGPSFNPLAPKAAGWNSAVIDHLTREGLVAKYTGHPGADVSRIEHVDFVWTGGPLSDAVPPSQHGSFDAFIASHVIEHTPDLIAFLDSACALLKPEGVVILAIPDRRYCFDYFQPLTTTGQLLEAHAEGRSRHTRRLAFDHFAYAVEDGGIVAWFQRPSQGLRFTHGLRDARDKFDTFEASPDYVDLHAWRFVPPSFELLLLELARLGETDWRMERVTQAEGCEFFAWLRRGGAAAAAALTDEQLDARRMALLQRTLLETQPQIDWLLAGDPGLRAEWQRLPPAQVRPSALTPGSGGLQEREAERLRQHSAAALEAELARARAAELAASAERDAVLHSATWRATRRCDALPNPCRPPRREARYGGCFGRRDKGHHRNLIAFPQRASGDGAFPMRIETVFLFDLDGTLVDSVYQHVLAWRDALDEEGIELSVWRIHRKIGMSGGLFTNQLLRETQMEISPERVDRLRERHAAAYNRHAKQIRPLPGARELLETLTANEVPWAIATSGRMETAATNLAALGVDPERNVVVTRDLVKYAKPDPDLFLAAAERLGARIDHSIVVGDSLWDMLAARRCRALGVGLLSGGYGADELERGGAARVYEDPADMLVHLDEVGGRR